jgi:hypothetical protein
MKTPTDEATNLRREIGSRESTRGRLPRELRERCERYAAERAAAGVAKQAIASELGVSAMSVQRWLRATQARTMVPVRIVGPAAPPAADRRVVVVTPSGLRVEGLDLDGVCTLVARVG